MFLLIRIVVAIIFAGWLMQQVRKPGGWMGRTVARAMGLSHSAMTDWGLQQLTVAKNASALDVGCGGGRTVGKLTAFAPEGRVVGLDHSAASVAVARETNAEAIKAGRVAIEQGSVAALPFPDGTFDIVTAVETHYYWPNLPTSVREVFRVIKPGGTFALIAETYRGGPLVWLYRPAMALLRAAFLTDAEHQELLSQAGFSEVRTEHVKGKNWICAIGRRPL